MPGTAPLVPLPVGVVPVHDGAVGIRSRGGIGGAGAVAALLAVLVVSPAGSTPPGRDGLIAYVSHGGPASRNYGIVLVKADGRGLRNLTANWRDRSPAWSPDGSKLVFVRAGRLYVIGSDGSGLRRVTPLRLNRVMPPAWSPDGRSIAFVRGENDVCHALRWQGDPPDLQARRDLGQPPSWSPDGKSIAFGLSARRTTTTTAAARSSSYEARAAAFAMSPTGGSPTDRPIPAATQTTTSRTGHPTERGWHSHALSGSAIAVTRKRSYSVAADGSDVRWITTDTQL